MWNFTGKIVLPQNEPWFEGFPFNDAPAGAVTSEADEARQSRLRMQSLYRKKKLQQKLEDEDIDCDEQEPEVNQVQIQVHEQTTSGDIDSDKSEPSQSVETEKVQSKIAQAAAPSQSYSVVSCREDGGGACVVTSAASDPASTITATSIRPQEILLNPEVENKEYIDHNQMGETDSFLPRKDPIVIV